MSLGKCHLDCIVSLPGTGNLCCSMNQLLVKTSTVGKRELKGGQPDPGLIT